MKPGPWFHLFAVLFCWCLNVLRCAAATVALTSPTEIPDGLKLNFDGHADYSVANTLFADQRITFSRDDGRNVYLSDWTGLGRTTTSPENVLATVMQVNVDPLHSWVTHLNVIPSTPLFAVGAYFGNDQMDPDFRFTMLSVYGSSDELLGSTQVDVNDNTSVDQFIGLRSDVPIYRVRFENFTSLEAASRSYSVVIDDLVFAPVPEPASMALVALGLCGVILARSRLVNRK